jgi:NAD(P)-dependent dehydrogenase (short-subunit alcohol dehydrogenase family)
MNSALNNQSVVVVGGTSGMGLAIARLAASRGAYVTIGSRSPDKVAAAASEIGVTGKPVDTTNEDSVREFFSAAGHMDQCQKAMPRAGGRGPLLKKENISPALADPADTFWPWPPGHCPRNQNAF